VSRRRCTKQANNPPDQDAVIKALKQQIADLQSRTSDLSSLKKEVASLSKENARLTTDNKKLSDSLAAAHSESKTLSTKLAAARSTQPDAKPSAVPGSAAKPRSNGILLPGALEAAKEAQLAHDKVDLYSDLTNLIIVGMKRNEDDEPVYDCLQPGKQGSMLHPPSLSLAAIFLLTPWLFSQHYTSTSPLQRPPIWPMLKQSLCTSRCWMSSGIESCWMCCRII
jgi:hypothetical protein